MHITPLFCSFFASDLLDLDNKALAEYCQRVREEDPGRVVSNQGGWQSNLIEKIGPELQNLYNSVMARVDAVNTNIGYDGPKVRTQTLWININGKEHYNEIHDHPSSFYAAVYYVKAAKDQGSIKFHHPMPFFSNYSTMNKISKYGTFNSTVWEVEPKSGLLLIFPAYLAHFVSRNMTDEERISIAFNIGLDWSDVPNRNL